MPNYVAETAAASSGGPVPTGTVAAAALPAAEV